MGITKSLATLLPIEERSDLINDKNFTAMKVELEKIKLGHSPLTDSVFAGVPLKEGQWKNKVDVTNSFISCVISRWENQKEIISSGKDRWEISVKKLK